MMIGIILWLLAAFSYDTHPFHVSVCEIEYNQNNKALEVTFHIFLDDLEETLSEKYNIFFDIVNPGDRAARDRMIREYVTKNFGVAVNEKEIEIEYVGHEVEGDAMYCYILVSGVKKMRTLKVSNTILIEKFDDQINIVHVDYQDKVKSLKLDKSKTFDTISYE